MSQAYQGLEIRDKKYRCSKQCLTVVSNSRSLVVILNTGEREKKTCSNISVVEVVTRNLVFV